MRYKLALLALYCGAVAAQTLADDASLTVVLRGQRLPAPILTAMQREAQAAVEPSGLHVNWRSQNLPGGEVAGQVAIVQLHGQCGSVATLRALSGRPDGVEPLGQTHVSDGKVLPFADLLCDAVHRLVDRDLRGLSSSRREELLGRALGRVLAHELFHILLRTTDHGFHGLSRSEQTSADLLAPAGAFAESDERRLAESVGADSGAAGR